MLHAVIRADATERIGIGHIMRCLVLADKLREQGAYVTFLCSPLPSALHQKLIDDGYNIVTLPVFKNWSEDAEAVRKVLTTFPETIACLIVDHYGIDYHWETQMRSYVEKIALIDDMANRKHDCDILLDQNYVFNMNCRYEGLLPKECRLFLGPAYALLRHEFHVHAAHANVRRKLNRVLISFGGSDPTGETRKVIMALREGHFPALQYDIIVGAANKQVERILADCSGMPNVHVHVDVQNMSELMRQADICIGSPGISTWERCMMGLPSVHIVVASNQHETAEALAANGLAWNMGWHESVTGKALADQLILLQRSPDTVEYVSEHVMELMELAAQTKKHPFLQAILEGGTS
ncbi:UDP-2,4-diacetamido-2,4,6-trideoxy-beta-L-altropyranose hydrolase [Paenibacillus apiarius]|uniref:UDP-2,4-diacetamido-2,4, 6-trideoxy-beta-L-altropyranose hydrolase n=1 Tax=Paenibacillus apiarius TaxID=46240 RepID=UPI00197E3FF9|nr:UDP-2,4-diacetamido-2,4,6-trideoxy-beta-L-altropyranose hydrolase [Paenibacillus apiarius]MBN3523864.1 UDP-2,4-diacetamido-2,4,6-trideoxy-beta-L-altropyranose hydrolase [Paenibacillus apiarius]